MTTVQEARELIRAADAAAKETKELMQSVDAVACVLLYFPLSIGGAMYKALSYWVSAGILLPYVTTYHLGFKQAVVLVFIRCLLLPMPTKRDIEGSRTKELFGMLFVGVVYDSILMLTVLVAYWWFL